MQALGCVIWLVVGTLQLFATFAGFQYWLGVNWVVAIILAAVTSYIPLVGTVLGMVGAIYVWGWPWWEATLLFFGSFLLMTALGGLGAVGSYFAPKSPH